MFPGSAGAQVSADTQPEPPAPIQNLAEKGAQIRYLGEFHGLQGWIAIQRGQEQFMYVLPNGKAFVMGLLFDEKGRLITMEQLAALREGKEFDELDLLADETSIQDGLARRAVEVPKIRPPSEMLFEDVESANWIALGADKTAPALYAFLDPQCSHCHAFLRDVTTSYLDAGRLQIRMIPVGFRPETLAQAAFLLAAPDAEPRWYEFLDGDETALPVDFDLNTDGVQFNASVMHRWKFDATPIIVYRAANGKIRIVRGRPKDPEGLVADLRGDR